MESKFEALGTGNSDTDINIRDITGRIILLALHPNG